MRVEWRIPSVANRVLVKGIAQEKLVMPSCGTRRRNGARHRVEPLVPVKGM
jgi:hypothetical protein